MSQEPSESWGEDFWNSLTVKQKAQCGYQVCKSLYQTFVIERKTPRHYDETHLIQSSDYHHLWQLIQDGLKFQFFNQCKFLFIYRNHKVTEFTIRDGDEFGFSYNPTSHTLEIEIFNKKDSE